jgi:hypothetical protein
MIKNDTEFPSKGDSFYKKNDNLDSNSWLNKDNASFYNFAKGYEITLLMLCNDINENMDKRDYLINPLLFNLRHYLELIMKAIIENLRNSLLVFDIKRNEANSYLCMDEHKLLPLWDLMIKLLGQLKEHNKDDSLTATKNLIKELQETDPNGENFRYPFGKNKNNNKTLDYIDVVHLIECGKKLINILDSLFLQSKLLKAKSELNLNYV